MDFRDLTLYEMQYQYREREKLEHAEQVRLVLSVTSGEKRLRFYYPVIARFGRWLMVFGHYLRKRYGKPPQISTSQPAQRSV
jgi:hypothetical protein